MEWVCAFDHEDVYYARRMVERKLPPKLDAVWMSIVFVPTTRSLAIGIFYLDVGNIVVVVQMTQISIPQPDAIHFETAINDSIDALSIKRKLFEEIPINIIVECDARFFEPELHQAVLHVADDKRKFVYFSRPDTRYAVFSFGEEERREMIQMTQQLLINRHLHISKAFHRVDKTRTKSVFFSQFYHVMYDYFNRKMIKDCGVASDNTCLVFTLMSFLYCNRYKHKWDNVLGEEEE